MSQADLSQASAGYAAYVAGIHLRKRLLQLLRQPMPSIRSLHTPYRVVQDEMWDFAQRATPADLARMQALVAGLQSALLLEDIRQRSKAIEAKGH